MRELGRIDILVNNAGGYTKDMGKPLHELTDADWHDGIDTNLTSQFYCCRAVLTQMVKQKRGKIINIASGWGLRGGKRVHLRLRQGRRAPAHPLAGGDLSPGRTSISTASCPGFSKARRNSSRAGSSFRSDELGRTPNSVPWRYSWPPTLPITQWRIYYDRRRRPGWWNQSHRRAPPSNRLTGSQTWRSTKLSKSSRSKVRPRW